LLENDLDGAVVLGTAFVAIAVVIIATSSWVSRRAVTDY
jgi:hypothetical protein